MLKMALACLWRSSRCVWRIWQSRAWVVLLALGLVGPWAHAQSLTAADRAAQEDDIREAVFRWQFDNNVSSQKKSAKAYCVKVSDHAEVTDAFLKRFGGHQPPVRNTAGCKIDLNKGAIDVATGGRAIVFSVSSIVWKSDAEVQVSGGFYEAPLSGAGNTFSVTRLEGRWKVVSSVENWVS